MGKRRSPDKSSERKKWDKIFNALVKLSQKQQNEREILEGKVKHLHGFVHKMIMEQKVHSSKAELILGLKERESMVFKHRYENAENDIAGLTEWCDYLAQKCSGSTDIATDISNKVESSRKKALQDEVRKLKREFEKYKEEKNSEISALLSEKTFVWNQYKQMETSFTEQLRNKSDEVENANEKVQIFVSRAEELHTSNEKLKADVIKMKSESIQKDEKMLELKKEIESLKSRSGSASTLLRPCRADAASSSRRGKNSRTTCGSIAQVKEESDPSQTTEKTTRTKPTAHKSTGGKAPRKRFMTKSSSSSKRKVIDVIIIPDTPKLFTSSFKVPKLKNSSASKKV